MPLQDLFRRLKPHNKPDSDLVTQPKTQEVKSKKSRLGRFGSYRTPISDERAPDAGSSATVHEVEQQPSGSVLQNTHLLPTAPHESPTPSSPNAISSSVKSTSNTDTTSNSTISLTHDQPPNLEESESNLIVAHPVAADERSSHQNNPIAIPHEQLGASIGPTAGLAVQLTASNEANVTSEDGPPSPQTTSNTMVSLVHDQDPIFEENGSDFVAEEHSAAKKQSNLQGSPIANPHGPDVLPRPPLHFTTMPTISDIPAKVLLENLLPMIPLPDLLSLAQANRFFNVLVNDDTFWKKKLDQDYNFSDNDTARVSGWKTIYRGLHNPRVFVWGDKGQCRLGLQRLPYGHVATPVELRIPGARVVSLTAGGMSFHALDSEGDVYVWGTLDGSSYASAEHGYSRAGKAAVTPHKLSLPAPTRAISCGRLHAATLDMHGHVWNFVNWGHPFRLASPHLHEVVQVECGWEFTSALTKSGKVLVWFPFAGALRERVATHAAETADKAQAEHGTIPCLTWECGLDPSVLPPLPDLPSLQSSLEVEKELTVITQIAAMELYLIALTNKGHVLKFGVLDDKHSTDSGQWRYLPQFSEASAIRQNPIYTQQNGEALAPPEIVHITHITAHFQRFVAYSTISACSSIVLIGSLKMDETSAAEIIPSLQYRGVISVLIGDYHYAALTDSGDMLTWGQYSNGALGLGDPAELDIGAPGGYNSIQDRNMARDGRIVRPPDVTKPSRVKFLQVKTKDGTREKKVFCFSATAFGWHTGALVIDLDPDIEEEPVGPW